MADTLVWPENRDFGMALGLSVAYIPIWPISQCSLYLNIAGALGLNVAGISV